MILNSTKNNAQGLSEEWILENEIVVLKSINDLEVPINQQREITLLDGIHFHFNLEGEGVFSFNHGSYKMTLESHNALLMYNPLEESSFNLSLLPSCRIISIFISIKKFHALFSEDSHYVNFLSLENRDKKYYDKIPITPSLSTILHQMIHMTGRTQIKRLYIKAKTYELLSLFFDQQEDPNIDKCPFLADDKNIEKIKKVKEIIISKMSNPPTLTTLADMVGISTQKLKTGFKQTYGDSVFGFLLDYKLEYARNLILKGCYSVSAVSHNVGYSAPSHFITAFKKKFGITPKQYSKSLEI